MGDTYRYSAFISYSHRDKRWVSWLHPALERYRTPRGLVGQAAARGGTVPASLFPVFSDRSELPTAADLNDTIQSALRDSRYLLVVCSPNSARSQWVDAEVRYFKSLGREGRILCLIVAGEPNATDTAPEAIEECFAPSLRVRLTADGAGPGERIEPLAADLRKDRDGKRDAFLKTVAGLLGVSFADLKRRDLIRQRRRRLVWSTAAVVLFISMFSLLLIADRQRNQALVGQSRFLSRLALNEVSNGNASGAALLALAALPKKLSLPDRPFVPEAEYALERAARQIHERRVFHDAGPVAAVVLSPDGTRILSAGIDSQVHIRDRASGAMLLTLAGHRMAISAAVYSPDGNTVATASLDGTVRLWNAHNGAPMAQWEAVCAALAFAADGSRLAGGCLDGKLFLWDTASHRQVDAYRPIDRLPGANAAAGNDDTLRALLAPGAGSENDAEPISHVAFSPGQDQSRILVAYQRQAVLLDAASGVPLQKFPESSPVLSAEFSRDGQYVVTAAKDGTARIWDAQSAEPLAQRHYPFGLRWAGYVADKIVATAGEDGAVRFWDLPSDGQVLSLGGHDGWVNSVTVSSDGGLAVTGSADGTVRVWDLAVQDVTPLQDPGGAIDASSLSRTGAVALTGAEDGTVRLWDTRSGTSRILGKHDDAAHIAKLSNDGIRAVSGAGKSLFLWNLATASLLGSLQLDDDVTRAAFSANSARVMAATDEALRLWDARTGKPLATLTGTAHYQDQSDRTTVNWETSGRQWAARSSDDNTVNLYVGSGLVGRILKGHTAKIVALTTSPDNSRLLSASEDGTARLWSVDTGTTVAVLSGHRGAVRVALYSPRGDVIATASDDGSAMLWDAASGARLAVLQGHRGPVRTAVFSDDGAALVTTSDDHTARIWDVRSHTHRVTLTGHAAAVVVAKWCANDKLVVTVADDATARVWDPHTGATVGVLRAGSGGIRVITCVDEHAVITGGDDGSVRLWNIETGSVRTGPLQLGSAARVLYWWGRCPNTQANCFAGLGDDGRVVIWDAVTGERSGETSMFHFKITAVALSPDGSHAAAGLQDGTVRLWDVDTGRELAVYRGHQNLVFGLLFAPDGKRLASLSPESLRVWDVSTSTLLATLTAEPYTQIRSAAFAPTDERIAVGSSSGVVHVWNPTSRQRQSVTAGPLPVTSVAFSADGVRLSTASLDGTVKVFDAHTTTWIDGLEDVGGALAAAEIADDGQTIMTQPWNSLGGMVQRYAARSGDGVVRIWRQPRRCQALIDWARRSVPRKLSKPEREVAFLPDGDGSDALTAIYTTVRPWFGWILSNSTARCR